MWLRVKKKKKKGGKVGKEDHIVNEPRPTLMY